jgi:hypothetical protein
MRLLKKPTIDALKVYNDCIGQTSIENQFTTARGIILKNYKYYEDKAKNNELYKFRNSMRGEGNQAVIGNLKKQNLVDLYSSRMVEGNGRKYYDTLIMHAPLKKCPFCGFGQVSTLDHFLSKSYYPIFSILPINLIPSCTDCNKGKGASTVTKENQIPHPYFESSEIENDIWLFSEIQKTAPPTATFHTKCPAKWQRDLAKRIETYFKDFNLAHRFSIEASNRLISICYMLKILDTIDLRKQYLETYAKTEITIRKNSWEAALYTALVNSDWFIETGFML